MTLPRSFWDKAEKIAAKFRKDLGINDAAVVDVAALAALVRAIVVDGADLIGREPFGELNKIQDGVFAAATFQVGGHTYIVTNPLTTEARRRSDIAHELAHLILGHQISDTRQIGDATVGVCTPKQNEEATGLGATLLLPKATLEATIASGANDQAVLARRQKVPVQTAGSRLHVTGLLRNNMLTNQSFTDTHPYS